MSRLLAAALAASLLAACQSAAPPAPQAGAKTVGDWTVSTSGRIRVDTIVVH